MWKVVIITLVNILTTILATGYYRRKERKQDTKLYVALMIGGFIWSQCQAEYMIWRNKRNMKKY
jgi:hypothetical protein